MENKSLQIIQEQINEIKNECAGVYRELKKMERN